ncbi:MAG: hypothetical protein AB7V39_29145, partial [Nitrospiraceae bacterium]
IAVVSYYTGGLATSGAWATCTAAGAAWSPIVAGMAGGFTMGVLRGGTLEAGLQGAFTGALFGAAGLAGGAGEAGANSAARYMAHAAAGCASSVAGGGKCGSGAASGLFGKYTSNQIGEIGPNASLGEVIGNGVATSVAGGIGSVIAGGKFANGAETAAYGYLFNQASRYLDSRLTMADRRAGLEPSREKTDAFENEVRRQIKLPAGKKEWSAYLDDQSSKFGWAAVASAANPLTAPGAPVLGLIGEGAGLVSQIFSPRPVTLFTDQLVDRGADLLPKAVRAPAAQLMKDAKNATPIGNQ